VFEAEVSFDDSAGEFSLVVGRIDKYMVGGVDRNGNDTICVGKFKERGFVTVLDGPMSGVVVD
jgi:hypothetical protein